MRSVLERDSEHLLPRPNVFMLALAVSPEWVPDVLGVFFLHRTWSTATRGDLTLLRKPPDYTHKPAPFNESDDSFKEKLHPFKPVEPISQRDAGKKKKKPVYLQFTANANRKDKSGTCASYYERTPLCVMSAACIIQGRGGYLCPLYLYHSGFEKGGKNQRDALSKEPENFFCQSATFSSKIVDITEINMQLLVWGRLLTVQKRSSCKVQRRISDWSDGLLRP